jgi:site-specific recombinase XerD
MPRSAAAVIAMEPVRETIETFDVEWFLGTSAGGESTRKSYRQILSKLERMVDRPLATATTRDLDTLKKRLRQMRSGLQYVRVLRMFYLHAEAASNDQSESFRFRRLAEAARMKEKRPRMDPAELLTPNEVNRMINAALTLRDRALFGALYETGCRISEALALDWRNVTHEPAAADRPEMYALWFPKMKVSGPEHQGFVIDTVAPFKAWLETHPTGEGALFCTAPGGRLTSNGAWKRIKTAATRAGITKNVHPHSFRHARVTHLLSAGWSEARVKALLGWSPGSRMLDRYSHLTSADVRRTLLEAKGFSVPKEQTPTFTYRAESVPPTPVKPLAGLGLPRPGPRAPVSDLDETARREFLALLSRPGVMDYLARQLASAEAKPAASAYG